MGAHEAAQVGDTSDKSDEMRTAPPPLAKPSHVSLSEHQSARAAEAALEAATAAQQEQRVAAALAAREAAAAAEQRVLLDELHVSEEAIARNFATREAQVNQRLAPDVDLVYFMASHEYTYYSSTRVRELASLGADVSWLVPAHVATALQRVYADRRHGG
jgi:hypothetical protein